MQYAWDLMKLCTSRVVVTQSHEMEEMNFNEDPSSFCLVRPLRIIRLDLDQGPYVSYGLNI